MNEIVIKPLGEGVEGCYIKRNKFKTSRISVNMFVKTTEKTAQANAMLARLLTTASADYPDYTSLNKKLNELYGATLYGDVVKFGDMQMIKFVIAVLDDKYALNGEKISEQATKLLLSMIFNPPLYDGKFKESDFESERRLLIEQIEGEINDKRVYAIRKTENVMFSNEPAGVPRYGTAEQAKNITNEEVVAAHKQLLETAFVRVNVISESEPTLVFDSISDYFKNQNRNPVKGNETVFHKTTGEVKNVTETMDVTQGKLCMGFSIDNGATREDSAKSIVFVDMFGGGPYSKLFTNVREKQSLCYYCSARYDSRKSTFMVDSGVLEENREKAYNGILEQFEEMKKGNFTDEDLSASKMALCDSVKTLDDNSANIDAWYASRTFDKGETAQKYFDMINSVTREDVIKAANSVKLDTVYFLGSERQGDK